MNDNSSFADADFRRKLAAARGGCRDSLGELIEVCRPYLLAIANEDLDPRLRSKVGASDIVQESLLAAQADLGDFAGSSSTAWLAWLRGILVNDLLETRRKYRGTAKRQIEREVPLNRETRRVAGDVATGEQTPSSHAVACEERRVLTEALSRLTHDDKQVLRLRNWEQLSFAEIGERMRRTPDAIRKLWSRAILRLQRELEKNVTSGDG